MHGARCAMYAQALSMNISRVPVCNALTMSCDRGNLDQTRHLGIRVC